MTERTYEFTVGFVGKGETLEKAWERACDDANLYEVGANHADPVLMEFKCPICEEDCLPDANDTPDESLTDWNCQGCGCAWKLEDEKTFQTYGEDGMMLDEPIEWNFNEDDGDES